ncbi:hypothetical protein GCM10019059_32030 [Camelimonas fluminis]|uniref:MucR family transcriptional regulator n=1 Tax=Camelimonas fluminis TaxID=1576911 RepID=A0ABV7UIJ0_9HYPH|nr:MucR family transcriptional regulator [Camelimonas fluminis]GHE69889.1 hypothetical protein GCM10019059_32030 [Camelimonas fluminis]
MKEVAGPDNLVELTADIVSAYVANNHLNRESLADLIGSTHDALVALGKQGLASVPTPQKPVVSIKKSVTPDFIICLEDGKQFKSLKRHLRAVYGMTPEDYRAKWNLPPDYPMVAPNYSAFRSSRAKEMRLGAERRAKFALPPRPMKATTEEEATPAPRKRGGPRKKPA